MQMLTTEKKKSFLTLNVYEETCTKFGDNINIVKYQRNKGKIETRMVYAPAGTCTLFTHFPHRPQFMQYHMIITMGFKHQNMLSFMTEDTLLFSTE